jgi:hypothetical protein
VARGSKHEARSSRSVIDLTEAGHIVGLHFFSERAGDNSTINAANRAECAALG